MKKALIIGSAVADITIRVDHLPALEEDVNPYSQSMQLGGCACNVSHMFELFKVPYTLAAPVGKGIYGDFVRKELQKRQIPILFESEEENGCCYCIVDKEGRRTFMALHGAEYRFKAEWYASLDAAGYGMAYCTGFEVQENSGDYIVDFLAAHPELPFCYAPGTQIASVDHCRQERLLDLHPLLHLNLREARDYLHCGGDIRNCAERLFARTQNTVILTDGANSCLLYDGKGFIEQEAFPVNVVDSTGAGDSHIGTYLALICAGKEKKEALREAARIGAKVCEVHGPVLEEL